MRNPMFGCAADVPVLGSAMQRRAPAVAAAQLESTHKEKLSFVGLFVAKVSLTILLCTNGQIS